MTKSLFQALLVQEELFQAIKAFRKVLDKWYLVLGGELRGEGGGGGSNRAHASNTICGICGDYRAWICFEA
eukprot:1690527-Amphidinium_carterae.1